MGKFKVDSITKGLQGNVVTWEFSLRFDGSVFNKQITNRTGN